MESKTCRRAASSLSVVETDILLLYFSDLYIYKKRMVGGRGGLVLGGSEVTNQGQLCVNNLFSFPLHSQL